MIKYQKYSNRGFLCFYVFTPEKKNIEYKTKLNINVQFLFILLSCYKMYRECRIHSNLGVIEISRHFHVSVSVQLFTFWFQLILSEILQNTFNDSNLPSGITVRSLMQGFKRQLRLKEYFCDFKWFSKLVATCVKLKKKLLNW